MKTKLWIKSRVFLSFLIFTIIIVNIFAYLLYFFVSKNIIENTYKSINNEYQTITTFIELQKSNIFSLPKYEIEKINNLWFYFYIWNNDSKLQNTYKLWFYNSWNEIIYRWDYKWYNIILWKTLNDFNDFKKTYIEILIILNILLILLASFLSYFITKFSLKPFLYLTDFLNNYNLKNNWKIIKNDYWDTEMWKLTKSINNFIKNNNQILETQTNFIQDVSHELKTPLMQIDSNIELIEDKITDKKIRNRLNLIKDSTKNINEIITNLGFILRWEEIIRNKEEINISNYLENFIKKYETQAQEKNININIIKNNDLIINNNTYYLDRIFWNLISNAIYYNNWNNNIEIIINKDSIEIKDNWIGIEKSEINKIFSRFYRNKNSWIHYKNWNWLWLVIVKKICDMFWWKIEVESELWKWTTFKIKIK